MVTRCTDALREQLLNLGEDPIAWIDFFQEWKDKGPAGEYNNYFFGKDGAYHSPKLSAPSGKLMHVHLVPILDTEALVAWNRDWKRRTRKVSNRVLVYADTRKGDYLLIFVLNEPDAHAIANMATTEDAQTMAFFAEVAEAFIFDGSVIA
jgi:mRNA interferase YafO